MKTMCSPKYYHNDLAATHGLGHMMYGYVNRTPYAQVHEMPQSPER